MKIEITINGEEKIFDNPLTVEELLGRLEVPQTQIAVAVNDSIIARGRFRETTLQAGDRIEIVRPLGGG